MKEANSIHGCGTQWKDLDWNWSVGYSLNRSMTTRTRLIPELSLLCIRHG